MPCRVKKEVFLVPEKLEPPAGARIRKKTKASPPDFA